MYKILYEYFMQELRNRKINPQQSFYHYTSSNGLNGILNNKKIWFSNTKFLNDEQERYYTYKLLIDEIDKMDNSEFNENLKNYYNSLLLIINFLYLFSFSAIAFLVLISIAFDTLNC